MIRIARLDQNNRVVEILELENPRDSLHPDTLKLFVSATNEAEVGDYYENQRFVKKDPEDVEPQEIKDIKSIEKNQSDAKKRLQEFDLESIEDQNIKTVVSDIFILLNIS